MSDLDHLTLGDIPEDLVENLDGSVDVEIEETSSTELGEWLENLAEVLPEDSLSIHSIELVELVEKDKKSREKRDEQYEEGLRRTGLGDDAPGGAEFSGASKVVHPVLAEACVDFSSRAIKELFPSSGPVKPWITGEMTPAKTEKANRKSRYMNWQLTTQIQEYRSTLEQLLTQLPMGGSQYQKFYYDPRLGRIVSEFVPIDEVFLPYQASDFYTASRVTHRQLISRSEFKGRVKSGLYRDVFITDLGSAPEESSASKANNKIEGREEDGYNDDGVRAILEIYCWAEISEDIQSDGEYAPYIITIDEDSEKVLSIYRNWKEGDARFRKLDWFVEWKFIPWRGAYAIGLPHLIGGLSAALTGSLRALLDSAHINNAATMLKLKSGRVVGQNTEVSVTQVCDIEGPAGIDDIRKLAMPMPFNPPSPVLAGLMDKLYGLAKGVVSTAEDQIGNVGDRTPVGTTMALIEQGSNTYSAIHARLHESQKRALEIIQRLDEDYLDDEEVMEEFGEQLVTREDFSGSRDVIPVSDPTIFSEAQRFAQSQALLQMAQGDAQNPNIPWNQVNIRRRMLKQMRIEAVDELLPAPKEPLTSDLVTENFKVLQGNPLKAGDSQDHEAHIVGHLEMIQSPLAVGNPMVPPQLIQAVISHVNEHLNLWIHQNIEQKVQLMPGMDEKAMAEATSSVLTELGSTIQGIFSKVQSVQQALQQRQPSAQMPPEIQASIQIAQMDTQRKSQYDQGMLKLKEQELQQAGQLKGGELQGKQQAEMASAQADQARFAFEQQMQTQQQQFDQMLQAQRLEAEAREAELSRQVELLRNEQDNRQHQITELLKNHEDNQTSVIIEQMKQHLSGYEIKMNAMLESLKLTDRTPGETEQ